MTFKSWAWRENLEAQRGRLRGGIGVFLLAVLLPLLWAVMPLGSGQNNGNQLWVCKSNCKNLATALEGYAMDHGGHYPERLESLIGGRAGGGWLSVGWPPSRPPEFRAWVG